jgi:hypothetical protein
VRAVMPESRLLFTSVFECLLADKGECDHKLFCKLPQRLSNRKSKLDLRQHILHVVQMQLLGAGVSPHVHVLA